VQGTKYNVKDEVYNEMRGKYNVVINSPSGPVNYLLDFKSPSSAVATRGQDTVTSRFYYDGRNVRLNVAPERRGEATSASPAPSVAMNGVAMARTAPATALPGPPLLLRLTHREGGWTVPAKNLWTWVM
jgi:hypothetical protein